MAPFFDLIYVISPRISRFLLCNKKKRCNCRKPTLNNMISKTYTVYLVAKLTTPN